MEAIVFQQTGNLNACRKGQSQALKGLILFTLRTIVKNTEKN